MTIGPAPMMRMLCRSVRLGMSAAAGALAQRLFGQFQLRLQAAQHQVVEALEQGLQVMRTGARLGVPLEGEGRAVGEAESLQRAIEERAGGRRKVLGKGR